MIRNKLVIIILALLGSLCAVHAAIEVYPTDPNSDIFTFGTLDYPTTSGGGDYFITFRSGELKFNIYGRTDSGFYELLVTLTKTSAIRSASTNGNWFAYTMQDGSGEIFQLSGSSIVNNTPIASAGTFTNVLADNTVTFLTASAIKTYSYNGTWAVISTTAISLTLSMNFPPYYMTDSSLVTYDSASKIVTLYSRHPNTTWLPEENFSFTLTTKTPVIAYNGVDAVLISAFDQDSGQPQGVAWLYTKVEGTWTLTNTTMAAGIGLTGYGYFGYHLKLISADAFMLTAVLDRFTNVRYDGGAVMLLTRDSSSGGQWKYSKLVPRVIGNIYGTTIATNDHDIIIGACNPQTQSNTAVWDCYFHSLPVCFFEPIDVTCNTVSLASCASTSSIISNEIYTLNNPKCGTTLTTVDQMTFNGNTVNVDLRFTRNFVANVTCSTVVECQQPPTSSAPTSGPVSVNVPSNSVTPSVSSIVRQSWIGAVGFSALCVTLF